MKVRLSVIADPHAGSTVGLAPDEPIPHPEGATISPTASSRWLWSHFVEHLEREAEAAKDHDLKVLIFNGDLVDGLMHHGNLQLYHPNGSVERWIAERILHEAMSTIYPDRVVLVLGTPSHVGKMGAREESLGRALDAQWPGRMIRPEHRCGWHAWLADFDGLLVDVRHHGKMGRLPHTRESYHKRYAFDVWASRALYKGQTPPGLAIRSHLHKYADSGAVPPHKNGTRVIGTPCYQLGTEWVGQMAIEEPPDVGMIGLTIAHGQVRDVFPQIVTPTIGGADIWQP